MKKKLQQTDLNVFTSMYLPNVCNLDFSLFPYLSYVMPMVYNGRKIDERRMHMWYFILVLSFCALWYYLHELNKIWSYVISFIQKIFFWTNASHILLYKTSFKHIIYCLSQNVMLSLQLCFFLIKGKHWRQHFCYSL